MAVKIVGKSPHFVRFERPAGPLLLYFDHNATTPVAPAVADAWREVSLASFGNPSSVHQQGQAARERLETARRRIASELNTKATEIVFGSGGTESNNLAIFGLVRSRAAERRHVVTTEIEHPAVLECCRELEREGAEVTYVRPQPNGTVQAGDVIGALRDHTVLVSVMHANNETGTVQPIAEIAAGVAARRKQGQPMFIHSDGVQAFGKVATSGMAGIVDLYSISGHKIFAPKGIGALYVKTGTPLRGLQVGGRHERERRAGTENVASAVALARAVDLNAEREWFAVGEERDRFEREICSALDGVEVNGSAAERLPNTSSVFFEGISGESLVIALDLRGMSVSTGAACSSGSVEPSHVLLAMGRTREEARSSVRFSFSKANTREDVDRLVSAVCGCVSKLRAGHHTRSTVAV